MIDPDRVTQMAYLPGRECGQNLAPGAREPSPQHKGG